MVKALWGKYILSVLSFATPILALMEIKLQNILIWSPKPLKSILFRIPLGAHFLLIISTAFSPLNVWNLCCTNRNDKPAYKHIYGPYAFDNCLKICIDDKWNRHLSINFFSGENLFIFFWRLDWSLTIPNYIVLLICLFNTSALLKHCRQYSALLKHCRQYMQKYFLSLSLVWYRINLLKLSINT